MRELMLSIQPRWVEKIVSGIYETKGYDTLFGKGKPKKLCVCGGRVVAEFVCDCITPLYNVCYDEWERLLGGLHRIEKQLVENACLTEKELHGYAKGKRCYGWHITDLVVYDEPRELSDFVKPCNHANDCCTCDRYDYIGHRCYNEITRPFQSWGYVEAIEPRQTAD